MGCIALDLISFIIITTSHSPIPTFHQNPHHSRLLSMYTTSHPTHTFSSLLSTRLDRVGGMGVMVICGFDLHIHQFQPIPTIKIKMVETHTHSPPHFSTPPSSPLHLPHPHNTHSKFSTRTSIGNDFRSLIIYPIVLNFSTQYIMKPLFPTLFNIHDILPSFIHFSVISTRNYYPFWITLRRQWFVVMVLG